MPNGDLDLWPWLADYDSHYESSIQTIWYFPRGYSFYGTGGKYPPYMFVPTGTYSTQQTVPDDWGQEALDYLNQGFSQLTDVEQSAIQNFVGETQVSDGHTNYIVNIVYRQPGTVLDQGVVVLNSEGVPEVRFPESDGYVHGYSAVGPNQFEPAFYRIQGNSAIRLSSIESVSSSALSYDSTTGLYSISVPDYSTAIAGIARDVEAIRNNPFLVDLSGVEIPPPVVTVNPEVTVTPDVTVNPQVTVNPTVTVTPDVTVNVNPNVELPSTLNVGLTDEGYQDVVDIIDESQLSEYVRNLSNAFTTPSTVQDFDTSEHQYTQEEQSLLDVVNGWNTQIPVISNACNVAFNTAFGSIPSIPASNLVPISGINILGFNIVIDLRPYATMFAWFRAFVLMLEVVWFIDAMWRTCVNAFKV